VEGDDGSVVPERDAEWCHVRLELRCRLEYTLTADVAGPGVRLISEVGIDDVPGVAARPAGIGTVSHAVERLGRQVVAKHVAAVVRGPGLAGGWVEGHADGVAQTTHEDAPPTTLGRCGDDRRALLVGLPAHVAAGSDADQ